MSRSARAALLAAAALTSLAASSASAWAPIDSSRPVWTGTVPFYMHDAGSVDLGVDTTEAEVQRGMLDWTRVSCTSLRASYMGRTSTRPGTGDSMSVIGWVESSWPARYGSGAIGVTTPQWGGRGIFASDMEMNGVNYTWITGSGRGSSVNAYSIILHEGGHFYGLGHSSDSRATMYYAYSGGIAALNADDEAGICALYPGSGATDCTTTGCPSGQTCVDGVCTTGGGSGATCAPCSSPTDCSGGALCLRYPDGRGYCGATCGSGADCGSGEMCVGTSAGTDVCVRFSGGSASCAGTTPTGCTNDAECASGQRCNPTTRMCEARTGTGTTPLGGACESHDTCASGLCAGGICTEQCDWLNPDSCPAGYYCNGDATGTCGSGFCAAGSAGAAGLGDACAADTDCASLYCAGGRCSEPCVPGGISSCPAGYACQVGVLPGCGACQIVGATGDECDSNDDCASSLCATVGDRTVCTEICDAASGCPSGFSCVPAGSDVSVCIGDGGGLGEDCGTNTDCTSGICASADPNFCTRLCTDTSPCPREFACVATTDPSVRICQPRATSSGGCGCTAVGAGGSARGVLALGLGLALALTLASRRRGGARRTG